MISKKLHKYLQYIYKCNPYLLEYLCHNDIKLEEDEIILLYIDYHPEPYEDWKVVDKAFKSITAVNNRILRNMRNYPNCHQHIEVVKTCNYRIKNND